MASGVLLYGMALLFGASGSVALSAIAAAHPTFMLMLGAGLLLIGIAFKLSLVPFHVWTPDVYEGAPLAVTAFMSVVTKAGALAVLCRFAYASLPPGMTNAILVPVWVIAALSMLAGNLGALAQTDMKRLLAYSGIAQVGYIVVAFAGQSSLGVRYAIFYLAAYTFMNLGAFAVVALLARDTDAIVGINRFAGLAHRRPWLAAAMTFFLLGLAGLPPTAGFTGKILILASSVSAGYAWLAGVLIIGTAISIYVYVKIVRVMFVRVDMAHVPDERPASMLPWVTVAICAAAVFALGVVPLTPSNVLAAHSAERHVAWGPPRADAITTGFFCDVERFVGVPHQIVGALAGLTRGDADADREKSAIRRANAGGQHRVANPLRNRDGAFERRVFEDHDKLFATVARRKVAAAIDGVCDRLGDAVQRVVALLMTEGVVVQLESVDVDHCDCEHTRAATGTAERTCELFLESPPVR